jgi:hypothetical protein
MPDEHTLQLAIKYASRLKHIQLAGQEQVNVQWNDDEVCFVLDQHAKLDFYSASLLKQQSMYRHITPIGHIILIPS